MNTIFVGSSRPEAIAQKYMNMGSSVNFAGMTLQNALIDGLYFHDPTLSVITAWDITPYPKVSKIIFKSENVNSKHNNLRYKFVGAINLPIVNMLTKFIKIRSELKKQLRNNQDANIIVYETYTPFILAVATLRKKKYNKAVVIVPDLPAFMHGKENPIRRFFKKINESLINWCLQRFDGYVLLSEPMLEKLPSKKNYIVMEGIFNPEFEEKPIEKEKCRTIMYTGGVFRHRGTDLLLEAFSGIKNPNYRLWIRGNGDLQHKIQEMAKQDNRITYFEPMNREDLLELERRATVMVNTTPPQDFTKYFFPSKNMEYMASGTPTIMFRLGCMPKEYNQFLYYVDLDDANSLREKLLEICEKPQNELDEFGNLARKFILENKNPRVQCGRIIDFLKSC